VEWLTGAGLGLDHTTLRLERTSQRWIEAGERLRDVVADQLIDGVAGVELIGSSAVIGLLAKPIVDIAVGLAADQELSPVQQRLASTGWIYRGDAGDNGGHVFVLEAKPLHRVAHVHVVDHEGDQWRNYLRLRDLLRHSPDSRARYESVKQRLAAEFEDDRTAYTDGKSAVIGHLLDEARADRTI
jgi:GrpB-like predicted nucleotidyltransferase (UPF0157 family)